MPETDKDIAAKKAAEAAPQAPGEQPGQKKPAPKLGDASKFTGPEPQAASKIFEEILAGGRESLLELIGLLRDPADANFDNYKAAYVLHGIALHVGQSGQEQRRRMFADALASQVSNANLSRHVRACLIRELQVAGGREVAAQLAAQLGDEMLCEYATQALVAIGDGAAAHLRKALGQATGPARVTIAQALGVLRDAEATDALKTALTDANETVRVTAACALANIGAASAADAILKVAEKAQAWERIQLTKACFLLAERLAASNRRPEAGRIYKVLRATWNDPAEKHVKEAADQALKTL